MKIFRIAATVALFGAIVVFCSCSSGLKAYQKGDYYRSCTEAVERLRSDPNNKKARVALSNSYPLLVKNTLREVENALGSKNLDRMEATIALYERMDLLAEAINHSPAALDLIPNPVEYHAEKRDMMEIVGQIAYLEGVKALDAGTMDSARAALDLLLRTDRYIPGYRDVAAKIAEARYKATLRVVVVKPLTNPRYQIDADFFYNKLMADITRRTFKRLVRFYTPEEAAAEKMTDPQQLLVLNFEDFTVGNTREVNNTIELRRDSVVVGTTMVNGRSQNVYGTVKAKYTTHRIELISAGVLSVRTVDPASGRVFQQRNIPGQSVWYSEFASYNGDERALSQQQKNLAGRRAFLPIPPPQELFASFADPLYAKASSYIVSIY